MDNVNIIDVQPPHPRTSLSPDISASRIPKLKSKLATDAQPTDDPHQMTPVEVANKKVIVSYSAISILF